MIYLIWYCILAVLFFVGYLVHEKDNIFWEQFSDVSMHFLLGFILACIWPGVMVFYLLWLLCRKLNRLRS